MIFSGSGNARLPTRYSPTKISYPCGKLAAVGSWGWLHKIITFSFFSRFQD
jgi:hypothetical protein